MVANRNNSGFRQWLAQRITAILIGSYAIVVIAYLLSSPNVSHTAWTNLYSNTWMRIYTVIVLFAVLWHTWIGLWTVFTDYIKPKGIRLLLQALLVLVLLAYLIWCLNILWG